MYNRSFSLSLLLGIPLLTSASYVFPSALLRRNPTYTLKDNFVGAGFLDGFTFETSADPAHGRVNYVDQATAQSKGLVSSTAETFTLRADANTVLSATGAGRDSVRLKSKNTYTTHLAVFDISHMPQGCGTWPALWETNDDPTIWPAEGEVDIMEGVNDQGVNRVTLHTTAGCTMPAARAMSGASVTTDCNWEVNGNTGCVVASNKPNSFGPSFNGAGGGWYVLECTSDSISVWFWGRSDVSVPSAVKGGSTISSATFGTPLATFPSTSCDIGSHFGANNIIVNIDFCGDWAGSVYAQSGCPGTCEDYVNANPAAFANAFWLINGVRVYT